MSSLFDEFAKAHPRASEAFDRIVGKEVLEERRVAPASSTSTGILSLDLMLGGALPSGIIDIFGRESTGKTLLGAQILATAQKTGYDTALCAPEGLDKAYMANLEVNLDNLPVIPADDYHNCWDLIRAFVSRPNSVLLLDSVSALRPGDGTWKESTMHELGIVSNSIGGGSSLILISQVRQMRSRNQNEMYTKDVRSVSEPFLECLSCRLKLEKIDSVTPAVSRMVGYDSSKVFTMNINVVYNIISKPANWVCVSVIKGKGLQIYEDYLNVCSAIGILHMRGPFTYFGDHNLGLGLQEAWNRILSDPDLEKAILDKMREEMENMG